MKYTLKDFSREFGQPIFNLGLGAFLIEADALSAWVTTPLSIMIVVFGMIAVVQFSHIAAFWKVALENPDKVGPGGQAHEGAQAVLDRTCLAVVSYRYKETFWFNVAASMILLIGLFEQNMVFALGVESVACVVVFAVSRSFLTHFPMYYKLVEGKELEDV